MDESIVTFSEYNWLCVDFLTDINCDWVIALKQINNAFFFSNVEHHLDRGNGMERTCFSVSVLLLYCGNCTSLVKIW